MDHGDERGAHPPNTKDRGRWTKGKMIAGPEGSNLVATVYHRTEKVIRKREETFTRVEYRVDIELTTAPRKRVHQIDSAAMVDARTWMDGFAAAQKLYGVR